MYTHIIREYKTKNLFLKKSIVFLEQSNMLPYKHSYMETLCAK